MQLTLKYKSVVQGQLSLEQVSVSYLSSPLNYAFLR